MTCRQVLAHQVGFLGRSKTELKVKDINLRCMNLVIKSVNFQFNIENNVKNLKPTDHCEKLISIYRDHHQFFMQIESI